MDNDIVQRHLQEKFPFHLKHTRSQTPGEGWSLFISPRGWQTPLPSPTSYKLKTNSNSPTTVKIPFSWGKKISLLGLKTSTLSKFLTNHKFSCLFNKIRFEWPRSPEKTALWPCPQGLVSDTCWRFLSSFSLFNARHRLWQSCPGEEPNCWSYFSGLHTKQHSCNRAVSSRLPCSLYSKPGKCDSTSLLCPPVSLPTLVKQEHTVIALLWMASLS